MSVCIITILSFIGIAFPINKVFAGNEGTEIQNKRDELISDTNHVIIEMGVLRDLQNEMWRLKLKWDACQADLREMGLNKLGDTV